MGKVIGLLLLIAFSSRVQAINNNHPFFSEQLKHKLQTSHINLCPSSLYQCESSALARLYSKNNYQSLWFNDSKPTNVALELVKLIQNSAYIGINPNIFHIIKIKKLMEAKPSVDNSLNLELYLTNAYLLYSQGLASGFLNYANLYPKYPIRQDKFDVVGFTLNAWRNKSLSLSLTSLPTQNKQCHQLIGVLSYYLGLNVDILLSNNEILKLNSKGSLVKQLIKRMHQLDPTLDLRGEIYDTNVVKAVKSFQWANDLKADGEVGLQTLAQLNIPIKVRVNELALNIDRLRLLPSNLGVNYIWVNLPDYKLSVYLNESLVSSQKVIVGSRGNNKSCIVSSKINYLELNPYWGIPFRIAINEYLAKIKQESDYLKKHHIRVFDPLNNQEINPASIDWLNLDKSNFNYFLRQDPGKSNALGKIKFLFPNQCGIFLHDTANPKLFAQINRSLSHGCIRVSEPLVLARLILRTNSQAKALSFESAIDKPKTRWISLAPTMPLYITYLTNFVESSILQNRRDIYQLNHIDLKLR